MFKAFKKMNENSRIIADRNNEYKDIFKPTVTAGNLQVDEVNELFRVKSMGAVILKYSELVDYELVQDDEVVTSGGLGVGRAVAGSLIAGPVGAVLGGLSKGKKSKKHTTNLHIEIKYKFNDKLETMNLVFINGKVKQGSLVHKLHLDDAKKALLLFDGMVDDVEEVIDSPAEELMMYKELLDVDAITQEEFDEVKTKLLNK